MPTIPPILKVILVIPAFGLPAYVATRLRLTARKAGGGRRTVSSWLELSRLKTKAVQAYTNRLLLKMVWAWALLCAPLLSYSSETGLDFKMYGVVFLGCALLGIILSAVTYNQIEKFDEADFSGLQGLDLDQLSTREKQFLADHFETSTQAARAAVQKSNRITLALVIFESSLVPLLQYPAAWASGLSNTVYMILLGGLSLFEYIVYWIVNYRFI